jgi:hypothetical protein
MSEVLNKIEQYAKEALSILQKSTSKRLRVDRILLSNKMKTTMGYALYEFNEKSRRYRYTIKISGVIFKRDSVTLKESVYHEVAHLVDYQIYKQWGHGHTWIRLMHRLGIEPVVFATDEEYLEAGYTRHVK